MLTATLAVSAQTPDERDAAHEKAMRFNLLLASARFSLQHKEFLAAERTLNEMEAKWPDNVKVNSVLGELYY